jgi:hypothetical protein
VIQPVIEHKHHLNILSHFPLFLDQAFEEAEALTTNEVNEKATILFLIYFY